MQVGQEYRWHVRRDGRDLLEGGATSAAEARGAAEDVALMLSEGSDPRP